jgi:hypothetical protein
VPRNTDFQACDGPRPDQLIEPDAEDQRGDPGPQACSHGAGAPVVNDRAALIPATVSAGDPSGVLPKPK